MKHSKKMIAVAAAAGLAMGTMPAAAHAQAGSGGLLDLGVDLNVGTSLDLGVNLGLGSLGIDPGQLPDGSDLAGSLDNLQGAGSSELASGSDDLGPALGEVIDTASAGDAGSSNGEGSNGEGSNGEGSNGTDGEDGFGDLILGSLGSITEGAGSDSLVEDLGGLSSGTGSDSASDELEGESGGISSDSLGENSGSGEGSSEGDEPSIFARISEFFEGLFDTGSTGSEDSGSEGSSEDEAPAPGEGDDIVFNSTELDAEALLALGSLAGAGIAVGIVVSGGVQLPPLPAIDAAFVCSLPQEGIDFLKGAGSMQPQECLPEEQN